MEQESTGHQSLMGSSFSKLAGKCPNCMKHCIQAVESWIDRADCMGGFHGPPLKLAILQRLAEDLARMHFFEETAPFEHQT
jgi:hypothetical protein